MSELKLKLQRLRALERLNRNSKQMERSWSEEVRRRLQVNKKKQKEEEEEEKRMKEEREKEETKPREARIEARLSLTQVGSLLRISTSFFTVQCVFT